MKHFHHNKPLMLVIDTSVFLHKLHQSIPVAHNDPQFESIIKANLAWLVSGQWLGQHKYKLTNIVFVKDTKTANGYWRTEWLADIDNTINIPRKTKAKKALAVVAKEALAKPEKTTEDHQVISEATEKLTVAYKGGRKLPDYSFKKLRKLVYDYIEAMEGVSTLAAVSYEADDMAAAIVQTNRDNGSPFDILLLTVDTDWLGLGGDDVTWCCMSGFVPVIRDTIEVVNTWAEKRLKETLTLHRDIWDIKGQQGDASDNLPPSNGVLLPVIDLLNPPVQYRYWLKAPQKIARCFETVHKPKSYEDAMKARQHLKLNGLFPIVRYLPGEEPDPSIAVVLPRASAPRVHLETSASPY